MPGIDMSKELTAMVQVEQALNSLSDEEQSRVLTWASARFGVAMAPAGKSGSAKGAPEVESAGEPAGITPDSIGSLGEFYDLAGPSTDSEKVLVVGYWFQYREGAQELESQKLNSELKHLGYGIGNVTRALEWHKSQKPALMIQKRKEGTTKQARKKFVVTNEGKKFVERMINKVN